MSQTLMQHGLERRHLALLNTHAGPLLPVGVYSGRRKVEVEEVRLFVQGDLKRAGVHARRFFLLGLALIGIGFVLVMLIAHLAYQPRPGHIASMPYAFERAIYEWLGWHRVSPAHSS
jgi:hypothetical protein